MSNTSISTSLEEVQHSPSDSKECAAAQAAHVFCAFARLALRCLRFAACGASETPFPQALRHQLLDCERFLIVSDFADTILVFVGLVGDRPQDVIRAPRPSHGVCRKRTTHFFSSVGHPSHRARKHIIEPLRRHGQRAQTLSLLSAIHVDLYLSMKTIADADPGSCQYRDDQQSQQTQCASQIAAYLNIPTRVNTQLLHLSLNLAKSLLHVSTRSVALFHTNNANTSLAIQRRQAQSTKQTVRV